MSDIPVARALLTPEQAAKALAISTRQLRALTQDGSIRYVNIGRLDRETRRYDPSDLAAFIEERKCQSTNALAQISIPTTSSIEVVDFRGLRSKRRSEKLSNSRKPYGTSSRPQKPTQPSP